MRHVLRQITLWQKFGALGAIGSALILFPLWLYVEQVSEVIDASALEQQGVPPVAGLLEVVRATQTHRGLAHAQLSGDERSRAPRQQASLELQKRLDALDSLFAAHALPTELSDRLAQLRRQWRQLRDAVDSEERGAADAFAEHSALVARELSLLDALAAHFTISLDPSAGGYFLISASIFHLPHAAEALARSRGILAAAPGQPGPAQEAKAELRLAHHHFERASDDFARAFAAEPDLAEALGGELARAKQALAEAEQLVTAAQSPAASARSSQASFGAFSTHLGALYGLGTQSIEALDELLASRTESLQTRRGWLVGLTAVLAALGAWTAALVVRSVVKPLEGAVRMAEAIGKGDLTQCEPPGGTDEPAKLLMALESMRQSWIEVVRRLESSSASLAHATEGIASGNGNLSARTQSQAESLEETARNLAELTSTVQRNARHAEQVAKLAESASEVAERGKSAVLSVVSRMQEIQAASEKISGVIELIDEIAYQTTILALNAAVEAARVGEHGRGFQIVAAEIRNLANRAGEATAEIHTLVLHSVESTRKGAQLAEEAGRTIEAVAQTVSHVTGTVASISAASSNQSTSLDQVSQAVNTIDGATRDNSALVAEIALTAKTLDDEARTLHRFVQTFDLPPAGPNTAN
jgi:methyl-accepting chemotaxis protein